MSLFYNFNDISHLDIFNWVDFSSFTSFEQLISTITYNILFYLFLTLFIRIAYKTICRIINIIF